MAFKKNLFFASVFIFLFCSFGEAAVTLHYPSESNVGQPFVAFVSSDVPFASASVIWMEKEIPLDVAKYDDGYRAYALLGSDANRIGDGTYTLEFRVSREEQRTLQGVLRVKLNMPRFREQRLTVSPQMVNPPKSELKRIEEEQELTRAARAVVTPRKMWQMKVIEPIDGKLHITSPYGYRRVYNGVPRGRHSGVDLRAPRGTPIKSIFPGIVVLTGEHYFAGKSVYTDSGNGVVSAYFHLDTISVKEGDFVSTGDLLGTAGATGRVTGPHLHLSVFLSGQSVDVMGLIGADFQKMIDELSVSIAEQ